MIRQSQLLAFSRKTTMIVSMRGSEEVSLEPSKIREIINKPSH
jgi:hypothetical protein